MRHQDEGRLVCVECPAWGGMGLEAQSERSTASANVLLDGMGI